MPSQRLGNYKKIPGIVLRQFFFKLNFVDRHLKVRIKERTYYMLDYSPGLGRGNFH